MTDQVVRLFPAPAQALTAHGLYLDQPLRHAGAAEKPFVYANFLSSLDGRIALGDDLRSTVPDDLVSALDLRLLLELQCQADCLVTHGAYLRAWAEGRLGNVLQVGADDSNRDLARWRSRNSLAPQPDVVILSASLEFPIPAALGSGGQRIVIVTVQQAPAERVAAWEARGYTVLRAGAGRWVEAAALMRHLTALEYRRVYLLAGPRLFHSMLSQQQVHRVFVTLRHRIIGGHEFHTMARGEALGEPGELALRELYLHDAADAGSQWFAVFEPARQT